MGRALAMVLMLAVLVVGLAADAATRWGWLGVRIRDLSEQEMNEISAKYGLREGFGALIVDVMKETPADAAGLMNGDLVVAFKNRPIVDTRALQRYVASASIGEMVTLIVFRRDQGRRPIEVRIGPMPVAVAADRVSAEYGFLLREPEAPPEPPGAVPPPGAPTVAVVLPGGRAEAAGLQVGDVLIEVDAKPVENLEAVRRVLLGLSERSPLSLVVRRDRQRLSLVLQDSPAPR
jgi:serine protease Do